MLFSTCTNDDSIGPVVSHDCRHGFDFTIKFEQLLFSLLPSAVFILAALWRITLLARRPTVVDAPIVQLVKLGTISVYLGLQLALLILVGVRSFNVTILAIACAALQFVTAFCMMVLSFFDHNKSPRPSALLSAYLLLSVIIEAAETRTLWVASRTKPEQTYSAVFTASEVLKAVILLLEAQRKTKFVKWDDSSEHSPEETSGIFSLGMYFWLNRLFLDGYGKVLQIRDLYPLDGAMGGQSLYERLSKHMVYKNLKGKKYGLVKMLARTLVVQVLLPIPPRLAVVGFTFCQPFFINRLTKYLSQPEAAANANFGYGLVGASIFIYLGIAISTALYWYFQYRMLYMARSCLVTAIYAKATEAQVGSSDDSAPLTLMSTDIERIILGFRGIHDFWGAFIEVGLASWLLYDQLGAVFVVPIVVVLLCALALSVLVKFTGNSQRAWMARVQKRVSLTASVIANMKNLKMSGLATPITEFVQRLRVDELETGSRFRQLAIIAAVIAFTPMLISPFTTFAFAGVSFSGLDTTRIFTSLAYLLLMANPLGVIFQGIPQLISGLACLGRIQAFLACDNREDIRAILDSARADPEKEASEPPVAYKDDAPAITVRDGRFGWEPDKIVLDDININMPSSSLTIIVGPIASGKSTLLKSLLGEIPVSHGPVTLSTRFARVGYCDQSPFLSNTTVKDNIIGFAAFDPHRYAEILDATMLKFDLDSLPLGDKTNVGSNGISLSGGQKQRISLARALYLQSDLLVFDDVFSGLDADTEEQVFQNIFGSDGITMLSHLAVTVVEQETFTDLLACESYVHSLGVKASSSYASSEKAYSQNSQEPSLDLLRRVSTAASIASAAGDRARQTGDRSVYNHYFKSMGLFLAGNLFFWGGCFGFFYNFPNIWLTYWAADSVVENPAHSYAYYAGIYALLEILCLLCLLKLTILLYIYAVKRTGAYVHRDALRTLVHAPLSFFTKTDQGIITNLFSQDMNLIDTELPSALLNTLFSVFTVIGQACVMVMSSPYIAATYPFLIVLLWMIQKFYLRNSRQLRLLDLETKSPLYTHFLDTSKGIVTLRVSGFVAEDRQKNIGLLDTSQRPAYLRIMIQQWLMFVLSCVVMIMAVIPTALVVMTRSSAGFTGGAMKTLMQFGEMLSGIVMHYTQLETSMGAISRLISFNKMVKPEDREEEDMIPVEDWPQKGRIELKGVSASYGTEDPEDKAPHLVLRDINLTISFGEKVAICGRTGSGKSSFLALLMKLLDPVAETPANIYIDNAPLNRLDRCTLRRRIIAIPQEAVFLPDGVSFQTNLDSFETSSAADCQSVLETMDLWSFVLERGGLDAGMSEGTLSQGQRQLFSLARAVLRRRNRARSLGLGGGGSEGGVLLLDEVSSSVDQETERVMQEIIRVEFKEYTIVAVSHRLDMIMDFDRVVVMDRGEVVEVGNPRVMAESELTWFGDLWRAAGN